jgi:hypothetical protein
LNVVRTNSVIRLLLVAALAVIALPAYAAAQTGYQLDNLSTSTVAPGGSVTVYANGFQPGSTATITLESDPVLLATTTAGSDGVVNETVTIPADTPAGQHEIVVSGVGRDGEPKQVRFPITITGTAAAGSGGSLVATGTDIGLALIIGTIAAGIGVVLLSTARRRQSVR